ncbi:hypothetical protein WA538_003110 [Blastocystis sp. DL]
MEPDSTTIQSAIMETPAHSKTPPLWVAHLTAISVHIIFGIGNCIGKEALKSMPPIIFAFYRELFAGLILLVVCLISKKASVHKEDLVRLFFVGLCMFGNQVFFLVGLYFAPAHIASIWQVTQPVITVIVTLLLHTEVRSWLKIVGIVLASCGAAIVAFFSTGGSEGRSILIGSCFFFINCVSNSLFVVVSKPLVKKYPAMTITSLSYNVCSVLVLLVGICMYWNKPSAWAIPRGGIWCLAYYVLIHSVTAYFLMLWSNKFIDASIISAYSTFQPVATTVLAILFLHERLVPGDWGAVLILPEKSRKRV